MQRPAPRGVASRRMGRQWYERDEWSSASRGRTWGFRLRTEAVVAVLTAVAARREDVFSLLQCERVQNGREWHSIYRELSVEGLTLDGPWQYLIRSRALNPAIPAPEPRSGAGWPSEFALNGLIVLHHPDPVHQDHAAGSRIGVMHRIGNERTGAVHEHREADALYGVLKRALKSAGADPA